MVSINDQLKKQIIPRQRNQLNERNIEPEKDLTSAQKKKYLKLLKLEGDAVASFHALKGNTYAIDLLKANNKQIALSNLI